MTRLVVVSNRIAPIEEGKATAGGLSVAVEEALAEVGGIWFGWSGNVEATDSGELETNQVGQISYITMPLTERDYEEYYKGFANSTLWPLFHYRLHLVEYEKHFAAGYLRVNQTFASHLAPLLEPDDMVWVHDYHLILLGRELRRMDLNNRMGFFLHTPFPPPDVLEACSDHEALVKALFAYDVIGFQTEVDVRNLLEYVRREANGKVRGHRVEAYGRTVYVAAFPIGIHPDGLQKLAAEAAGTYHTRQLIRSLGGKDLIIGVDRLDYSKGLDTRFEAYDKLLANYPENRDRVTFLQIAPPSREEVESYQEIRATLEGLSGRINGKYAEFDWVPLRYLNKSFQRDTLMGFFRAARVGLVTPLRDGMNLVAKEYVASQDPEDPGVLVLSQFAGAARELDGAVIVNPYDVEFTADGLESALTMEREERIERWKTMMTVMRRHNLGAWRKNFLKALANGGSA